MTKYPKFARKWLNTIDYMNVFTLNGEKLSLKRSRPLIEQWDRIMVGLPARKKGGSFKRTLSIRNLEGKEKKNNSKRKLSGLVGKRKSSSSEKRKKSKPRGNMLAKPLGP